jgi:hypothetical protein
VQESDCGELINSYKRGAIACSHLRGRSCYSSPIQAAEYFLRMHLHLENLSDIVQTSVTGSESLGWQVTFRAPLLEENYEVRLVSEEGAVETYKSCSARELSPRQRFRFVECNRIRAKNGMKR